MKHGSLEFYERTEPLLKVIADEGQKVARLNGWPDVIVEVRAVIITPYSPQIVIRCTLRNPLDESAVDEPTIKLLDAAEDLLQVFSSAGTPLASVTVDWQDEYGDGRLTRRCQFTYGAVDYP